MPMRDVFLKKEMRRRNHKISKLIARYDARDERNADKNTLITLNEMFTGMDSVEFAFHCHQLLLICHLAVCRFYGHPNGTKRLIFICFYCFQLDFFSSSEHTKQFIFEMQVNKSR